MTLMSSLQFAGGDCTLPAIRFNFSSAQCNTHWPWLYLQLHYLPYRCLWFCDQAMMCRNMRLVSFTSPKAFVTLQPLITVFRLSFRMMYRSSQPWRNWAQHGQRRTGDIPLHSYRSALISLWTCLRCNPLTRWENSCLTYLLRMYICSAMLDKQTGKYRKRHKSDFLCPVQDSPLILSEAGKTLVSRMPVINLILPFEGPLAESCRGRGSLIGAQPGHDQQAADGMCTQSRETVAYDGNTNTWRPYFWRVAPSAFASLSAPWSLWQRVIFLAGIVTPHIYFPTSAASVKVHAVITTYTAF